MYYTWRFVGGFGLAYVKMGAPVSVYKMIVYKYRYSRVYSFDVDVDFSGAN